MSPKIAPDRLRIVEELEQSREAKGFKPGWLYFQCKDRGLLEEYDYLRRGRSIPAINFEPSDPSSPRLSIVLVPQTCWFSNVRSHVSKEDWIRIRKETAAQAHHQCEICGGRGPEWPVECQKSGFMMIPTKFRYYSA